jgi:hypothetical protein
MMMYNMNGPSQIDVDTLKAVGQQYFICRTARPVHDHRRPKRSSESKDSLLMFHTLHQIITTT